MTTYKLIKKLESLPYFNDLLKNGIIPTTWVDYKVIFEFYKAELEKLQRQSKKGAKRQAKTNTAQEFGVSERSVYFILKKLEG